MQVDVPISKTVPIVKAVSGLLIGCSVISVTSNVIRQAVPAATRWQRTQRMVAGYTIGGLMADRAATWFDDQLDEWVEKGTKLHAKMTNKRADDSE
jgi:cytochrome c oxidase assembly factor CtaG